MKQLRKLKVEHKKLLIANGYTSKDYLYERDTINEIVFILINTMDKLVYKKNEGVFE